eukprot:scaffold21370_cov67-Phaeocystis_antarctica.AAC.1
MAMAPSMEDAGTAETAARAADTERAEKAAKAKARRSTLLPFAVISITYLLFTVTDGALRMIVLLHAYNQSFSAMQVATMFTLYECAGVVTNLAAGFAGARWGIRFTLVLGLCLQLLTYGMLYGWREEWEQGEAILYVTISQVDDACCVHACCMHDVRRRRQGPDQAGRQDRHQARHAGGEDLAALQARLATDGVEELAQGRRLLPRLGAAAVELRGRAR